MGNQVEKRVEGKQVEHKLVHNPAVVREEDTLEAKRKKEEAQRQQFENIKH